MANFIAALLAIVLTIGVVAWFRGDEQTRDTALVGTALLTLGLGIVDVKRRKALK